MKGILMSLLVLASASSMATQFEIGLSGSYQFPQDEDVERQFGGEISAINWFTPKFGIGVAGGYTHATLQDRTETAFAPGATATAIGTGHMRMFPLGASLYFRPINTESVSVRLELGARYLFIKSEYTIDVYSTVYGYGYVSHYNETIRVEAKNASVAVFAADVEFRVSESARLFLGGGYMPAIQDSEVSTPYSTADYDVSAAFMRLGISFDI